MQNLAAPRPAALTVPMPDSPRRTPCYAWQWPSLSSLTRSGAVLRIETVTPVTRWTAVPGRLTAMFQTRLGVVPMNELPGFERFAEVVLGGELAAASNSCSRALPPEAPQNASSGAAGVVFPPEGPQKSSGDVRIFPPGGAVGTSFGAARVFPPEGPTGQAAQDFLTNALKRPAASLLPAASRVRFLSGVYADRPMLSEAEQAATRARLVGEQRAAKAQRDAEVEARRRAKQTARDARERVAAGVLLKPAAKRRRLE